MKEIKSYSNVWNSEKIIYALNDLTLPRPVTVSQIFWFLLFFLLSLFLKGIPPFIFTDSALMNHVAIPLVAAWFISKKTFDGKKPYNFLKSCLMYVVSMKSYARGKPVVSKDRKYVDLYITVGKGWVKRGKRKDEISD